MDKTRPENDRHKEPDTTIIRKVVLLLLILLIGIGIFSLIVFSTSGINSLGTISGYNPVNLTEEEKAWIANHPVIRVCPDSNYPPFEMISPEGQYEGISADLLRQICIQTGLTLEVIHESDWNNCVERIRNGTADVLGVVYISNLRKDYLIYSKPYYAPLLPIITRSTSLNGLALNGLTLDQLSGKRVASVRGYTTTLLLKQEYPQIEVVEVRDVRSGLESVSLGNVDAYFGDLAASSWYVDKEGYSNLHFSGSYLPDNTDDFSYAFGIRKDYPELARIIDKGLLAIPVQKREEIFRNYISPTLSKPVIDPLYIYVTAGIVGSLFLVSLLFLIWNRTLKKVVNEKTRALTRELAEHRKTTHSLMMTRQAVDHSRAMILWLDDEGVIRDVNDTTLKQTGLLKQDFLGKDLTIFQSEYSAKQIKDFLPMIQEQEHFRIEMVVRLNKLVEFPAEVFVWYFSFEGTGMYCLEILDITERRTHEQERAAAIEQIQKNMAELSILNDGIRNPLTVILALTERECPDVFFDIERSVYHIDSTINQLDKRWDESYKILSFLKKHHGIDVERENKKE